MNEMEIIGKLKMKATNMYLHKKIDMKQYQDILSTIRDVEDEYHDSLPQSMDDLQSAVA